MLFLRNSIFSSYFMYFGSIISICIPQSLSPSQDKINFSPVSIISLLPLQPSHLIYLSFFVENFIFSS